MAKSKYVNVEVCLTKENAKILNNIDEIMGTKHSYINAAIEATANMKKFKDMRMEDTKVKEEAKDEVTEGIKE